MATKRNLIPRTIRSGLPKGLSEDEALVYWAAYQQGTERQLDQRLIELNAKIDQLQEQLRGVLDQALRAAVTVPVLPPGLPSDQAPIATQPPTQGPTGSLPGGVIDLEALRAEAQSNRSAPDEEGLTVSEPIGPWSAETLTEAMSTVQMLARPSRLPAAKRKALDWFRAHASNYDTEQLPTGYDRMLKYEFEKHGLLRSAADSEWEEEIEAEA